MGQFDDLDERATEQRDPLPDCGRLGVHHVLRDAVQ